MREIELQTEMFGQALVQRVRSGELGAVAYALTCIVEQVAYELARQKLWSLSTPVLSTAAAIDRAFDDFMRR